MNRRELLKAASLTALSATALGSSTALTALPASAAPSWPGHKPGRVYLGMSSHGSFSDALRLTGQVGLRRTFYRWDDARRESRNISADHSADRLPWVSFKPPFSSKGGWAAVASGRYDGDIRARARRYAALSRPVVVTFNHEPHNDATGTPAEFAKAWLRIHRVMQGETGLQNVAFVPIIGEWEFNPVNRSRNPGEYITEAVLQHCAFLGVDLYQTRKGEGYRERVGRVFDWLDGQGHRDLQVGIGETGCTDDFGSPSGARWWEDSWRWTVANRDRMAAISYFNSLHNNNSGKNWLLTQSSSKLRAFRASVSSATACRL